LTLLESVRFITVGPLPDEILALCTLTRLTELEIRCVPFGASGFEALSAALQKMKNHPSNVHARAATTMTRP